jgi:hypothetical protein
VAVITVGHGSWWSWTLVVSCCEAIAISRHCCGCDEGDAVGELNIYDGMADGFKDGKLVAVAEADWARLVRAHVRDQAFDEIMDVLE